MNGQNKKEVGDFFQPKVPPNVPRPVIRITPNFALPNKTRTYIFVSSHLGSSKRFVARSDAEAKDIVRKQFSWCPGKNALYRIEEIPFT